MSEYIYKWTFEDKKDRGSMWYITALSIVIWLSIWWFFTKQYAMSFIVLLIAWLYYFVENNSEDNIEVQIQELWIIIAWVFYDYESIGSFWVIYNWSNPIMLRLNLIKKWLKSIDVIINIDNLPKIRSVLSSYLEETPKVELSLSEKFIKILKL